MKKFLAIIVLGLFTSSNVYAEVYYCVDKDSNGFHSKDGSDKTYERRWFKPKRFKANIDFSKWTFKSQDLNYNVTCQNVPGQKWSMQCPNSFGVIVTIDGSTPSNDVLNYYRASTYGRGDSLVVAYGTCEIF